MTKEEAIEYAKSIGIDNIEELLSEDVLKNMDDKSLKLLNDTMLNINLAHAANNPDRKDGDVERALIPLIDSWMQEGNINGAKMNQANLTRLNQANFLALLFFKKAKFNFEAPHQNLNFAQTFIRCEDFTIDDEKVKNRELFNKLLALVDDFEVGTSSGRMLHISFSVNNVWEE